MMKLYELTDNFTELFDRFEDYDTWEPFKNEQGLYIDPNGELIPDPDKYITEMRNTLREAWYETLSDLEEDFEVKAVNIALYIKALEAEAEVVKTEKLRLGKRQKALTNHAERLRIYLRENMERLGRTKIDSDPRITLSIKFNPPSVDIPNEKSFIEWAKQNNDKLLSIKYDVARAEIKKAIDGGAKIPGASVVRKIALTLK